MEIELMSTEANENSTCGFVAIIGPANSGKSTLLNAMMAKKITIVSSKPQTTRNRILGIKNIGENQIVFIDTPGFVKRIRQHQLESAMRNSFVSAAIDADLIMLVLDAERLAKGRGYLMKVKEEFLADKLGTPDFIVVNKIDCLEKERVLIILDSLYKEFSVQNPNLEIFPISARKEFGLVELEKGLIKHLPKGPKMYPEDMVSDQDEEFFVAEMVREKAFQLLHEEIPYSLSAKVTSWTKEKGKPTQHIAVDLIIERESQKGIIVGNGGQMIKEIGTRARLELEQLLKIKIHLILTVKVQEDWSKKNINKAMPLIEF